MKGLGAATLSDDLHGSVRRPHGGTNQSSGGGQLPALTASPGSTDEGDDDGVLNRVTAITASTLVEHLLDVRCFSSMFSL